MCYVGAFQRRDRIGCLGVGETYTELIPSSWLIRHSQYSHIGLKSKLLKGDFIGDYTREYNGGY